MIPFFELAGREFRVNFETVDFGEASSGDFAFIENSLPLFFGELTLLYTFDF